MPFTIFSHKRRSVRLLLRFNLYRGSWFNCVICIHLRLLSIKTISMFLSLSSITTGANKEAEATCVSFRITWVSWDSCFAITFSMLCFADCLFFLAFVLYVLWYTPLITSLVSSKLCCNSLRTDNREYLLVLCMALEILSISKYCFILESVYASFFT